METQISSNNNFLPDSLKGKEYNTCMTINTDASFCPKTLAGGYAFWIVCDNFVFKDSDLLKKTSTNPTETEIKAIANAISKVLKRTDLPKLKHIVINTDSRGAIKHIRERNTPAAIIAAHMLDVLASKTNPQDINLRWVKSHSGVQDKRSKVNEWCDTQAKKHMIIRRKQIQKDGI